MVCSHLDTTIEDRDYSVLKEWFKRMQRPSVLTKGLLFNVRDLSAIGHLEQALGSRVRCRCCLPSQELTATRSFIHALGCEVWGWQAQYPGRELATIVEYKIRLGLF